MSRTTIFDPDTDVRKSMFGGMFSTTYLVPFAFRAEGFMFRKSMTIKPFFNDIS